MKTLFLKVISLPIKLFNLVISAIFFVGFYSIVMPIQLLGRVSMWPFRRLYAEYEKRNAPEGNPVALTPEEEITEWYYAQKERRKPKFNVRPVIEIIADLVEDVEDSGLKIAPHAPYRGSGPLTAPKPPGWGAAKVTVLSESIDPTRSKEGGPIVKVRNHWARRLREYRRTYAKSNQKIYGKPK